ncbi:MAG TPA: hypothetical protein VK549_10490, partial [Acidimicrobiia bacterium]|nr:hypothetical protein [Acidimicrobiia bacterium]
MLRVVRRLTFAMPRAVEPLLRSLGWSLGVAERARQRTVQRRLVRTLHFLAYWQGVAEEAHGHGELVALLSDAGPAEPTGDAEVDIDLAVGVDAAEARLDLERPASMRLRLGRREVGSIPAVPGAEPLRGGHLRPLLAGPLAGSFAAALQRHNASPDGESTPEIKQLAAAAARTRRPLVSVVIPFLDAEPFLDEAISSVFDQTYPRW